MKLTIVVVVLAWASYTLAVQDSEVYADPMELSATREMISHDKHNSASIKDESEKYFTEKYIHTSSRTGSKITIDQESKNSENSNMNIGYKDDINSGNSPWCEIAIQCTEELLKVPVCGYDDNFGFAKFINTCHMFKVNCYWNYNFTLVLCR